MRFWDPYFFAFKKLMCNDTRVSIQRRIIHVDSIICYYILKWITEYLISPRWWRKIDLEIVVDSWVEMKDIVWDFKGETIICYLKYWLICCCLWKDIHILKVYHLCCSGRFGLKLISLQNSWCWIIKQSAIQSIGDGSNLIVVRCSMSNIFSFIPFQIW